MKSIIIILLFLTTGLNAQRVTIVHFDNVNKYAEKELMLQLNRVYGLKDFVIKEATLPASAYYKPRRRYRADKLNAFLSDGKTYVLGITSKDISFNNGKIYDWGVMGLATPSKQAAVISNFRLKTKADIVSTGLHEVGHLLGLEHCPNKGCLMEAAWGKYIRASYFLCDDCKTILR